MTARFKEKHRKCQLINTCLKTFFILTNFDYTKFELNNR